MLLFLPTDSVEEAGLESEIVVRPHLLVPPGAFGGFDGTDDQRVETVSFQGVGGERVGHEERLHQSLGKASLFFRTGVPLH